MCLLCRRWMNWYRRFRGRTSPSPCGRRGRWRSTSRRISSTHSASGSRSGTLLLYSAVICTEPCSALLNKTEDKPRCLHYIIYSLKYKNISLDSTQTTIKLHLRWAYKFSHLKCGTVHVMVHVSSQCLRCLITVTEPNPELVHSGEWALCDHHCLSVLLHLEFFMPGLRFHVWYNCILMETRNG